MKQTGEVILCLMVLYAIIAVLISNSLAVSYSKPSESAKPATPASQPTSQPSVVVKIENFAFEPKVLEISAGTTVTWRNIDDVPHTATSSDDPQTFDSGALDTDDKFSCTFKKPGKYSYYCKVHPHMTGVIAVK